MTHRVVRNVTTGPVVVNDQGLTLHPGDWHPVLLTDEVSAAIKAGTLVDKTDRITEKSDLGAWLAKQKATELDRIEANRPKAAPRAKAAPATTMSDEAASSNGTETTQE